MNEIDLKSIKILYLITENMLPNTPLIILNLEMEYIQFVKDYFELNRDTLKFYKK